MCRYYFAHDITAGKDLKLQRLRATHGLEGTGVFWAILELLAEVTVEDAGSPGLSLDPKFIARMIGSRSPKRVESVIRDFSLFVIETNEAGVETFYSRRLLRRFTHDVLLREQSEADEEAEVGNKPTKRNISPEARQRMSVAGRKHRPSSKVATKVEEGTEEGTSKVATKVEEGIEEGTSKVVTKVEEGSEEGTSKVATKVEEGIEEGTSKVVTKVEEGSEEGTSKVATKVEEGSEEGISKVATKVEEGRGGNIGGLKAPKKKEKEKGKRETENAPAQDLNKMGYRESAYEESPSNGILTPILSIYEEVRNEYPILPAPPLYDSNIFYQAKELTDAWGGGGFRDRLGKALRRACASTFLRGKKNLFKYAWLTKLANLEKIEAGNYDDDEPKARASSSASTATHYTNAAWQEVSPPPITPEQQALMDRVNNMTLEDFYKQASSQP
nr:Lin1244/Lin1753 domain-containing protein [uncultured Porphyromonas sp.]